MNKARVISAIRSADRALSWAHLKVVGERHDVLLSFLFHGLFRDASEIDLGHADPQQAITVEHFRRFVDYHLTHGYSFVTPDDIFRGLKRSSVGGGGGKYVLIGFDDGYFSNHLAVPVLREFGVPATFFISTRHVLEGKCFWWDVLYRHMRRAGADAARIGQETHGLKSKTTAEIERHLRQAFGNDALIPVGDVDRPFTPAELRDFAREPGVVLGNHTADHAILANYTLEQVREQVAQAQRDLLAMTGVEPTMIAYPNGVYSRDIVRIAREAGLKLGVTVDPRKNPLPIDPSGDDAMRLGRFVIDGGQDIARQCATFRSDLLLYSRLQMMRRPAY